MAPFTDADRRAALDKLDRHERDLRIIEQRQRVLDAVWNTAAAPPEPEPGGYQSTHYLFRDLTADEVERFRQYARDHEPPAGDQLLICHPICRDEWQRLGKIPREDR